ncbi:MAG: sodium:solute symporter family protein [Candidatus Hydrogenedentales bacterium]
MPPREIALGIGPLVVLIIYLVAMIGIGWLGKVRSREKSMADFYLGGSTFGVFVLFLTLFATQYSGNTLLGFAGRSYQQGATYIVSVMFMTLAITVIVVYGPRLYKLARLHGYITPSDFIYHRYNSHALRVVCTLLFCWGLANYILEQLVAMGHAVEGLSGGRIPFMAGVVLLVFVMLIYESLGGMRSVAWTDVVQGLLLCSGCACILYVLLTAQGGLPGAAEVIREQAPQKLQTPDAPGLRGWISTLILLSFGVAVYPHAIQRVFAARNLRVLRVSLAGMAFMPLATTLLAFLLGYLALSRFQGLTSLESDRVTLYMLAEAMETNAFMYWVVVLVLVAIVAAIMSTSDSALLTIQSMVIKDLYAPFRGGAINERHMLRVGKVFGWVLMAVLVTQAWVSLKTESSIWLLISLKLEFMVQIAPVLILGLYWPRLPATAALTGVLAGTAFTLVLWVGVIAGLWDSGWRSPWGVSAGVWGLGINLACCAIGGLLAPASATQSLQAQQPAKAAEG